MRRQYLLVVLCSCIALLSGCGSSVRLDSVAKEIEVQELETQETQREKSAGQERAETEPEEKYEYYLTKEELLADIDEGIIFRVDTALQKPMCPIVRGGNWSFYVHEDNVVNLEIVYSDLIAKSGKAFQPYGEQVVVDVLSPDGDCVYHFERQGDEIMENVSIQEQIAVTPGEWTLQISFAYMCGEARSHFKVCAAYESPSEEDIIWLREERLKEHDTEIPTELANADADGNQSGTSG